VTLISGEVVGRVAFREAWRLQAGKSCRRGKQLVSNITRTASKGGALRGIPGFEICLKAGERLEICTP
jgi:hypothetical protein